MNGMKNQVLPTKEAHGYNGRSETMLTQHPDPEVGLIVIELESGKLDLVQTAAYAMKSKLTPSLLLEIKKMGMGVDEFCIDYAYTELKCREAEQNEFIRTELTVAMLTASNLSLQPITLPKWDD